jgi:hypothetical protein
MSTRSACTGESDAVLSARIAALLELRFQASDDRGLEKRREQLHQAFRCLTATAAVPLLERLRIPDRKDPLTTLFQRLSAATREQMIGCLEKTAGVAPTPPPVQGPGSLPPAVGEQLLREELDRHLAEALALPEDELIVRGERTLQSLRTIASDPLFAGVDPAVLARIEEEARQTELTLRIVTGPRLSGRRARPPGMAVGAVTVSPAAALAAVLALFGAVVVSRSTSRFNERDDDVAPLSDALRELRRTLIEALARRREPVAPPTHVGPEQRERRRPREPCRRLWVERPTGSLAMRYHNEYAAAMVTRLRISNVSPDLDFRITKEGMRRTDYDSYDEEKEIYYEFKTKHDYLANEGLSPGDARAWVRWMRMSEIFVQAWDQRMTLVRCGFDAEIVWIFEEPRVADAVRWVIGGWPIDRVIAMRWDRKDRARIKPQNGGTPP